MQGAASARDLFQDIGGAGGPDEGLGFFVVAVGVSSNGQGEFFEVAKDTAPQPVLGEIAKKAFYHVEARRIDSIYAPMKARVASQPALHLRVLMSGVVVADQV